MVRFTAELIPHGDPNLARVKLGECKVSNSGTGTRARGNYRFVIEGKREVLLHTGEVRGFPRRRLLAWDLLLRVLLSTRRGGLSAKERAYLIKLLQEESK